MLKPFKDKMYEDGTETWTKEYYNWRVKNGLCNSPMRQGGREMPLDKSGSKESVGKNIKAEEAAGKPKKQALAIALETQREAKKKKKHKHEKD